VVVCDVVGVVVDDVVGVVVCVVVGVVVTVVVAVVVGVVVCVVVRVDVTVVVGVVMRQSANVPSRKESMAAFNVVAVAHARLCPEGSTRNPLLSHDSAPGRVPRVYLRRPTQRNK
jgi:hypothetical protein